MLRSLSLVVAGILVVACSSVGTPLNIPSLNIPSLNLPSIPPINLPSGLPTIPPLELPSGGPPAEGNLCSVISVQEISTFTGGTATLGTDIDAGECEWTVVKPGVVLPGVVSLTLDEAGANNIPVIKTVYSGGQDVAVAEGGYWVPFISTLYYVDGGNTYSVTALFLSSQDPNAALAAATQIATTAAARL